MLGTLLGALTVAVIGNGLILAHISPFLTPIVTGVIILIAIWLNFRLFRTGRKFSQTAMRMMNTLDDRRDERRHMVEDEAVADHCDGQRSEHRAEHRAASAEQARTARAQLRR